MEIIDGRNILNTFLMFIHVVFGVVGLLSGYLVLTLKKGQAIT